MATEITVGELLQNEPPRDAIHVAITPVVCAAEELTPGQRIGFIEAGNTQKVGTAARTVGIVDPFLQRNVYLGQRFWMFLLPGQITALRHDWQHPAFATAESERWLRQCAADFEVTYEHLLLAAKETNRTGDADAIWHETPYAAHGVSYREFWKHYELVTGERARDVSAVVFEGCC